MTHQPEHRDSNRQDRRTKLAAAAVSGTLAGAARAILDWLLRHLTSA